MFLKSVKFQLVVIAFFFVVFVTIVLFQMFFAQKVRQEERSQLQTSYDIISAFLELEDSEKRVINELRNLSLQRNTEAQELELIAVKEGVDAWYGKLQAWDKAMNDWKKQTNVPVDSSIFSSSFMSNKEKQAASYVKAIELCREKKYKDVEYVLNMESFFTPSVHKTIRSILDGVNRQVESNRQIANNFYRSTAFAVLVALIALLFVSGSIARNLTKNLRTLEKGAQNISNGNFDNKIKVSAPQELCGLATAFNEMQIAIKSRDAQIHDQYKEIEKLNSILSQKIEDQDKTILNQNDSLIRKNEELEQILYAASHDLRTPLISIQGFSEELKMACESLCAEVGKPDTKPEDINVLVENEIIQALNYINNGSKRMELLLEGLLRLSRMGRESLQRKEIDMNQLLKDVTDALKVQLDEAQASLNINLLESCRGDSSQLEQVFFNLISNAIKYRSSDRKCEITVKSMKTDTATRYSVMDNGIGIPEEYLHRVFHAFFRVDEDKVAGDGVGLAIVNRAVDLHDGKAWVESTLGEGSTFTIEIPDKPLEN